MATVSEVPTLLTKKQFCAKHPAFSPGGLNWLLFLREQNGLATAVVRVGRRLLLDEQKFFTWLVKQQAPSPGVGAKGVQLGRGMCDA
jgi:hypothetical protein